MNEIDPLGQENPSCREALWYAADFNAAPVHSSELGDGVVRGVNEYCKHFGAKMIDTSDGHIIVIFSRNP